MTTDSHSTPDTHLETLKTIACILERILNKLYDIQCAIEGDDDPHHMYVWNTPPPDTTPSGQQPRGKAVQRPNEREVTD